MFPSICLVALLCCLSVCYPSVCLRSQPRLQHRQASQTARASPPTPKFYATPATPTPTPTLAPTLTPTSMRASSCCCCFAADSAAAASATAVLLLMFFIDDVVIAADYVSLFVPFFFPNGTGRDCAGQGGVIEHASATPPRGFQAADGHREDPEAPGARGHGVGAEGMRRAFVVESPGVAR